MKLKYVATLLSCLILISCGGSGGSSSSPDTSSSRLENPIRENTTPFGVSSFAIGVHKFPAEDNQNSENIGYKTISKAVRHIATNELYTFPEVPDHSRVLSVVSDLIDSGHSVTHEIHILNGPAMRRCQDRVVNSIAGRNVCDDEFDDLVLSNTNMRNALQQLFSEVVSHAKSLEALGASVIICPELEDNHRLGNSGSYIELIKLLENAGWTDRSKIVRNSIKAPDVGAIPGIRYELHPRSFEQIVSSGLRPGDIINTDGTSFSFNSDSNPPSYLISENNIRRMIDYSQERGIIFFMWQDTMQGLIQIGPNSSTVVDGEYANRNYRIRKPIDIASILLGIRPEEVELNP